MAEMNIDGIDVFTTKYLPDGGIYLTEKTLAKLVGWIDKQNVQMIAHDDEIRRECADIVSTEVADQGLEEVVNIERLRATILSAEPAQEIPKCTRPDDTECHVHSGDRCYNGFRCEPAQDDGNTNWLTTEAINAGLEVGFKELGASEAAKELYRNNPITNRIAHTIFSEVKHLAWA